MKEFLSVKGAEWIQSEQKLTKFEIPKDRISRIPDNQSGYLTSRTGMIITVIVTI